MLLDLIELVDKYDLRINGIIHIGGHYGEEDSVYNSINVINKIYVEPLENNFNILKNNVSNAILYKLALGSNTGYVDMYVETENNGQSSSILEPKLHLIQYPNIVFNRKETVEMKTLDSLNIDGLYNFINIDVQGYELEVFKGGVNTLNNIDYIMTEVNRDEVYKDCAKIEDIIDFLTPYGFKMVECLWAGDTWGDAFFIKI